MTYYHKPEIEFVSGMFISNEGDCLQKKDTGLQLDIIWYYVYHY